MSDEATGAQAATDDQDAQAASETAQDAHQQADAGGGGKETSTDLFPRVYVEELRRESAGYRTRAQTAEQELKALQEKAEKEREEVEAKVAAAEQRLSEVTIGNALTMEASRMGFIDPEDAVRLVDTSGVAMKEGKVEGVQDSLKALAARKPHLLRGRGVTDAAASGSGSTASGMNEAIRAAARRTQQ